jgi:hypothetical protein
VRIAWECAPHRGHDSAIRYRPVRDFTLFVICSEVLLIVQGTTTQALTLIGTQLVPFFDMASISFQDLLQLTLGQQDVLARGLAIFHTRPGTHPRIFTVERNDGMATELAASHRYPIQVRIVFSLLSNK